jgi:hypothetical protein
MIRQPRTKKQALLHLLFVFSFNGLWFLPIISHAIKGKVIDWRLFSDKIAAITFGAICYCVPLFLKAPWFVP